MSSFVLPAAMRPHPQFGTLADHPLQLTNVTLRDFVFGDLLFAVVNQFEGHFVASPTQAVHLHEVDRKVAAQGQFLAAVEEDRILIEEAEPTAVGPPRGVLVGDKPHHEVLAVDALGAVAQVETQTLLHRDGHRIFVIAQPPVKLLHHLAAQRVIDGDQHLRTLVKPPVGAVLPAAEMGRHGDPVAAVHRFHVFLHVFDREHRPALLLVHVGHVDRVDEDFGQRTVEPPPDKGQFAFALPGERVPQVGLHDLHAVAQAVVEQAEKQVLNDVVLEPIRHHGERARAQPEGLQPETLQNGQIGSFHACRPD